MTDTRNTPARPTEVFRARTNRRLYLVLAIVGALLIVLQVLLNVLPWTRLPINAWAMLTSAALGFWGFHGIDPGNSDSAADRLSHIGVSIITAVRGGRRASDSVVVTKVEHAATVDEPAAPETPPSTGGRDD